MNLLLYNNDSVFVWSEPGRRSIQVFKVQSEPSCEKSYCFIAIFVLKII